MKEYTYQEMLKMQDDALRRVREMQQLSQNAVCEGDRTGKGIVIPCKDKESSVGVIYENNGQEKANLPVRNKGFIDYINSDSDILTVLSLIVLLSGENADMPLIMALSYILL